GDSAEGAPSFGYLLAYRTGDADADPEPIQRLSAGLAAIQGGFASVIAGISRDKREEGLYVGPADAEGVETVEHIRLEDLRSAWRAPLDW
ncbi:MAG: hypothetical protein KDA33_14715, partial [Phycisphaerales bacterium]|nr:hypothetical protein [Phycisphaerales bacterium]